MLSYKDYKMDTFFINSENNKTSNPHELSFKVTYKNGLPKS